MENKLTINLVTWNGEKYIPALFESLSKQSYKNFEILALDNASTDNTVAIMKNKAKEFGLSLNVIKNQDNIGFAGAHNLAFKNVNTEYFLIINQDLYLESDVLEKMIKFMNCHLSATALGPRLMKWNFAENKKTNIIDSLGLCVYRNRRVVENGEGKDYDSFKNKKQCEHVFGISGAMILMRTANIKKMPYFFDDSLGSYKEDVDLAYRINSSGGESYILNEAVVYHDRTAFGVEKKNDLSSALNKNLQSFLVKYNSYKNHLLVIYKNEYWQNFCLDFPWIFWYELKKFFYFLFFDRKILSSLKIIWRERKEMKEKRREIINQRKIVWRDFRRWF